MRSGVITAVHQNKRNKYSYEIFIEGELAFEVHEDILVKYSLLKGTEIDGNLYEEVLLAEEKNRAFLAALRYIGIRPRSCHQVETYLMGKGYTKERAVDVRELCEQKGYLNDTAFAKQWVQERLINKSLGSFALRQELMQKGISSQIIQSALRGIDQDDEVMAARKLAIKKCRGREIPLSMKEEVKLLTYLMRKGFSHSIVQKIKQEARSGRLFED